MKIELEAEWGDWHEIDRAHLDERNCFGIYQIRMVDKVGRPIPISRIVGIDEEGVIYIGRSGPKKPRTLAQRIREFQKGAHSGAKTYRLMNENCESFKHLYSSHRLQYRAMHLQASEDITNIIKQKEALIGEDFSYRTKIELMEGVAVINYVNRYGELPPCNSSFPMWKAFMEWVQKTKRNEQR